MPLGKYPNFDACVADYIKSGKDKESASRICGAMEARMKEAATNIKYTEGDRHYIKAFLLDASENINRWGIKPTSLQQHINSFIGKPLVLTSDFNHPMPPDFDRVAETYYDDDRNPHNVVKVDDIVEHWLAYQEDFRVGNIIDITNKGDTYFAIIELTDPSAKEAFNDNDVPLFVSPAIAQLDPYENPASISNWTGVHLAIVSNPAYTIKKALVTNQCHESGDNHNESGKCLLQLRQASVINKDSNQKTLFGCGFCRAKALARYAEVVKSWHTKHSVTLNKPKTVTNQEDFLNSSIEFSDTNVKSSELTDQEESNNNQENNKETTTKETTVKETNKPIIKEPQEKEAAAPSDYGIDKKTGKYAPHAADTFGIKLAGMEECVQIFTQNGVTPDQSVQICKLAAKALMENQEQNPQGANKPTGNGPGISGQFGSITDYEKEIAKQEIKIGQLTEELRNYKKGDKTDAQRIAELEDTVSKLNSNLKEKELEAYLVTKISDVEQRNKKIKRFAELNMTIEDLKEIYDDKANTDPKVVKKTASVEEQSSPISKVKLQVASTNNSNEENSQVNEIRERNNRISSLLSNKRLQ